MSLVPARYQLDVREIHRALELRIYKTTESPFMARLLSVVLRHRMAASGPESLVKSFVAHIV